MRKLLKRTHEGRMRRYIKQWSNVDRIFIHYCSSCAPQLKQGLRNNPEEKKPHDYKLRGGKKEKDAQFRKTGIFYCYKKGEMRYNS